MVKYSTLQVRKKSVLVSQESLPGTSSTLCTVEADLHLSPGLFYGHI